jgi:small subunit ribosomal protein S20
VANHPSAEKRNRQRITRTARNRKVTSSVRTVVKRLRTELGAKNKETTLKALATAISEINKAASKGVVHPKAASRTIGRLSAQVHKLQKSEAVAVETTKSGKAGTKPAKKAASKAAPKAAKPKAE